MATVYLDTTFVSACLSTRIDAASEYKRTTSLEWWATQSPRHEIYISFEVIGELASPRYPQREAALEWVRALRALDLNEETLGLARLLVAEKVMPGPVGGDATHVAVACVHGIEYLLSWNVRHLANPNKLVHLRRVCTRAGKMAPQIVTPDLLWIED